MKIKKNRKGFTLGELLIVVAIIGVLVAVSVPIFTKQLKKARLATNQANARQALSAVLTTWMTEKYEEGTYNGETIEGHALYEYDPSTGVATNISEVESFDADAIGVTYGENNKWLSIDTNIAEWTTETTVGTHNTLGSKVYSDNWYLEIDENGSVVVFYVEY